MKLTDYIAIYGALLSTFVFLWNLLKTRRKIIVKIIHGIEDETNESGIYIFIQNPSSKIAYISSVSIMIATDRNNAINFIKNLCLYKRFSGKMKWAYMNDFINFQDESLPLSIGPGQSYQVFINSKNINKIQKYTYKNRIKVSVQDQLWNNTNSKIFHLDF